MLALRRITAVTSVKATRQFATKSRPAMAGGNHHDDHAHHDHAVSLFNNFVQTIFY